MAVRVNVSNNPITVKRTNILLTDVESAKRQEWERRRKLRLLQVRQQAKDLACTLRNKVKSEKEGISKEREMKCVNELEQWKQCQLNKLHEKYEGCLADFGAGHKNAQEQPEEGTILREQQELMAALSRARGEVAMRKVREEKMANQNKNEAVHKCKEMARNLENVRAQLVASKPKPTSTLPVKSKKTKITKISSPCKIKVVKRNRMTLTSQIPPVLPHEVQEGLERNFAGASTETEVPFEEEIRGEGPGPGQTVQEVLPRKVLRFEDIMGNYGCSSLNGKQDSDSAKHSSLRNKSARRNENPSPNGRRHNISECDYNSDDSVDSNVTWPPRSSASYKHPNRQKFISVYEHSGGTCNEYLRPTNSVTCIESKYEQVELSPQTLREEGGRVYKANLESATNRAQLRGKQALQKEHLRKEFSSMLQELTSLDREERMRRVNSHRNLPEKTKSKSEPKEKLDVSVLCRKGPEEKCQPSPPKHQHFDMGSAESVKPYVPIKHHVKIPMEETKSPKCMNGVTDNSLKKLLEAVQKKRSELLSKQLQEFDWSAACCKHAENKDESVDDIEIPEWIKDPLQNDNYVSDQPEFQEPCYDSHRPNNNSPEPSYDSHEQERIPNVDEVCEEQSASQVDIDKPESKMLKQESPKKIPVKRISMKRIPKGKQIMSKQYVKENLLNKDSSTDLDDLEVFENHEVRSCQEEGGEENSHDSIENSETSNSSFEGIKLIIKVAEKKEKRIKSPRKMVEESRPPPDDGHLDETRDNVKSTEWYSKSNINGENSGSTSTSYYSPPEYLSPKQKDLLNNILNKIEMKNKNPNLKQYILRLLAMSRESVDNLSESVSDVSINSDVINRINDAFIVDHRRNDGTFYDAHQQNYNADFRRAQNQTLSAFEKPYPPIDGRQICTENKQVGTDSLAEKSHDNSAESDEMRQYTDLAERYSQRINALAKMIDSLKLAPCTSNNGRGFDNSSYLGIPNEIDQSLKISDSIIRAAQNRLYPRPEQTFEDFDNANVRHLKQYSPQYSKDKQYNFAWNLQRPNLNEEDIAALGLTLDILPKPDTENSVKPSDRVRPKPPSTLQGINLRKHIPSAVPHELSAIAEAETPSTSHYQQSALLSDRPTDRLLRTSPKLQEHELFSCASSEAGLDLSSIAPCSPKRPPGVRSEDYARLEKYAVPGPSRGRKATLPDPKCDESSLSIISDLSDCSLLNGKGVLTESSSENLEEVFRSLGIAWAWTTLRKIKEAKRLSLSSPSPEAADARDKPCNRSMGDKSSGHGTRHSRYKHSTPVKKQDRPPAQNHCLKSVLAQASFGSSELSSVTGSSGGRSDSWSLTPPSLTLVAPSLLPPRKDKEKH